MVDLGLTIMTLTMVSLLVIIAVSLFALQVANENIFKGSGDPHTMANMLWKILTQLGQIIFGIFSFGALLLLIFSETVSTDTVLPLIGTIIGYVFGKEFKRNN